MGSFTPVNNEVYVLEAIKRIGGSGDNIMSMRTYICWNSANSEWESITTNGIFINTKTTALTYLAEKKKNNVSSQDTIGKISYNNEEFTLSNIGIYITVGMINQVNNIMEKIIYSGRDPFTLIKEDGNNYYFDTEYDLRRLTQTRDCSKCILTDIDLSKIDLRNKNLNYANFSGQDLSGLDFTGSSLSYANLSDANLTLTNLSGVDLTGADISYSLIQQIILDNTNFNNVNFSNSYISAIDFSDISLMNTNFNDAILYFVDFSLSDLSYSDLSNVYRDEDDTEETWKSIQYAELEGVNLSNKGLFSYIDEYYIEPFDLSNKNLRYANLSDTDLPYIDFTGADLYNSNLEGSYLYYSIFDEAGLSYAKLGNLYYSDSTSTFFNAYLEYTNLSELDFDNMNFEGSKFFSKDFSNYDLSGANFSYAIFDESDFTDAIINNTNFCFTKMKNTTWIDGTTVFFSNKVCDDTSIGACN